MSASTELDVIEDEMPVGAWNFYRSLWDGEIQAGGDPSQPKRRAELILLAYTVHEGASRR